MDTFGSLAIVFLAALIHASFQLSISVLTLLSGHAIGSKKSQLRVLHLTTSFVVGVGIMTILLLSFTSFLFTRLFGSHTPQLMWVIVCFMLVGIGIAVWALYYRKEQGTTLWVPRPIASYLSNRSKSTKLGAEAFSLGLTSVIGELLFIALPIIISALALIHLAPGFQLLGIVIYSAVSLFSLFIIWALIGSGHALSRIQLWREKNKHFLQFAAGSGLIILGFYVYVDQVMSASIGSI